MTKYPFLFFFFWSLYITSILGQNVNVAKSSSSLLVEKNGQFVLSSHPIITVAGTDSSLRRLVENFAQQLGKVSGRDTKVFAGNFRIKEGINFVVSKDEKLGESGYFLEITPHRIVITAEQINGFAGALEFLKTRLPSAIFASEKVEGVIWHVPCCYLEGQYIKP